MTLLVEIPAGEAESRFQASEVFLERSLGQPVLWRFVVHCRHDDERLPYLTQLLEAGPLKAKPLWKDAPLGVAAAPEATVVSVRWSKDLLDHIVVEAHGTTLAAAPSPAPDPDPFTPRWRVHDQMQNLLKVAQKFAHIATLPNWVKNELEKVKLTPDDFTSVVQDGLSDWAFLSHLMDQYGMLGAEAALKPLVLVGSVEAAPGKWIVTYGSKAAYDKLGDITNREVEPEEKTLQSLGFARMENSGSDNHSVVPIATRLWRKRPFTPDAWKAWTGKDLPLFTKVEQKFIHRITDRLIRSDTAEEKLDWSTELEPLPEGSVVSGPEPPITVQTWLRIGEVSETSPKGPFIKVKLEGFESGSEILQVRLQTPYGGTDGVKGLHLVPENKTMVLLSWSGRFHEPFLVLGNIRAKEVTYASPSLWLEALTTEQFTDILVKEVGKTTVESDYDVEMKKKTTVKSVDAFALTADATTDITSGGAFTLTGKAATTIESTGALKITGKATTDVASTGAFKIDGKATVDIAATGPFKVDAKATTDIASTGPITIDGKATTMVKGVAGVHLNP